MSLSELTDTHRAYLFRHLRPLLGETTRAGEVRNRYLHHTCGLFTARSSGTRTDARYRKWVASRRGGVAAPFSSGPLRTGLAGFPASGSPVSYFETCFFVGFPY